MGTTRLFKILQPVGLVMVFGGCLLAGQAFFGGEPSGEVGRQLVEYRWHLVLMAVLGLAFVGVGAVRPRQPE